MAITQMITFDHYYHRNGTIYNGTTTHAHPIQPISGAMRWRYRLHAEASNRRPDGRYAVWWDGQSQRSIGTWERYRPSFLLGWDFCYGDYLLGDYPKLIIGYRVIKSVGTPGRPHLSIKGTRDVSTTAGGWLTLLTTDDCDTGVEHYMEVIIDRNTREISYRRDGRPHQRPGLVTYVSDDIGPLDNPDLNWFFGEVISGSSINQFSYSYCDMYCMVDTTQDNDGSVSTPTGPVQITHTAIEDIGENPEWDYYYSMEEAGEQQRIEALQRGPESSTDTNNAILTSDPLGSKLDFTFSPIPLSNVDVVAIQHSYFATTDSGAMVDLNAEFQQGETVELDTQVPLETTLKVFQSVEQGQVLYRDLNGQPLTFESIQNIKLNLWSARPI